MWSTLNIERAREQHREYRRALAELGLEVVLLDRDDAHPDSCFVEDTAIVHGNRALVCRLKPDARKGEEVEVERLLKTRLRVMRAAPPATIEGGDVIHLPDRLISGLSQRTDETGVKQAAEWLMVRVDTVRDPEIMHLKSYVSYLGGNKALCTRRYLSHPALKGLQLLVVPDEEAYAANALAVGDTVLMSSGRNKSQEIVRKAGFDVVSLDTSEFEKCDGALTCLSILF